jgi:hypothetical protein
MPGYGERFVPYAENGEIGLFMFANPAVLKNVSREIELAPNWGFP